MRRALPEFIEPDYSRERASIALDAQTKERVLHRVLSEYDRYSYHRNWNFRLWMTVSAVLLMFSMIFLATPDGRKSVQQAQAFANWQFSRLQADRFSEKELSGASLKSYIRKHAAVGRALELIAAEPTLLSEMELTKGSIYQFKKNVLYLTYEKEPMKGYLEIDIRTGRLLSYITTGFASHDLVPTYYGSTDGIEEIAAHMARSLLGDAAFADYVQWEQLMDEVPSDLRTYRYYRTVKGIPILNRGIWINVAPDRQIFQYEDMGISADELASFPETSRVMKPETAKEAFIGQMLRLRDEKGYLLDKFLIDAETGEPVYLNPMGIHEFKGTRYEAAAALERFLDRYPLLLACVWPEDGKPRLVYTPSYGGGDLEKVLQQF